MLQCFSRNWLYVWDFEFFGGPWGSRKSTRGWSFPGHPWGIWTIDPSVGSSCNVAGSGWWTPGTYVWLWLFYIYPLVICYIAIECYWKWPSYSGFTHWKWWFSYVSLPEGISPFTGGKWERFPWCFSAEFSRSWTNHGWCISIPTKSHKVMIVWQYHFIYFSCIFHMPINHPSLNPEYWHDGDSSLRLVVKDSPSFPHRLMRKKISPISDEKATFFFYPGSRMMMFFASFARPSSALINIACILTI